MHVYTPTEVYILLEYMLSYINVLLVTFSMTPIRVYVLSRA